MKNIERIDELRDEVSQGKVVKDNYKDLCEWIGWEVSTNRKAQFKSICHWMKIEKVDNKYVISEVYDKEKAKDFCEKVGRPRKRNIDPNDYIFKRPVGRPRTKRPQLTIKEIEERQGYSLYFRPTAKYLEPAYRIIGHDILTNNGIIRYTHNEFIKRLFMIDYAELQNNNELKYLLSGLPELLNFWYYVKSCTENIIQTNLIQGLCNRKHIFDYKEVYYNSDMNLSANANKYATDQQNIIINNIITDALCHWDLSDYNELFYQSKDKKINAYNAKDEISKNIYAQIGWEYWNKGFEFTFTPQIPDEAVMYLKKYDITRSQKILNNLIYKKIIKVLVSKNVQYANYVPETNVSIVIGVGNDIAKDAHETFIKDLTEIMEQYFLAK